MFNILSYFLPFWWPSAGVWAWNCSKFENNSVIFPDTTLSWAQVLGSPSLVFSFVSWCSSFFDSNSRLDLSPGYYKATQALLFFAVGENSKLFWTYDMEHCLAWRLYSCECETCWACAPPALLHTDRYSFFLFLGKKNRPALPISPEKAPHNMIESGCFTVGNVNLGSNLLEAWGRRTIGDFTWNTWKLLSSKNITLFHCAGVQWMYCLANAMRCFFIRSVKSAFLAALRLGKPKPFCRRCCMVRTATFSSSFGCKIFSSKAVSRGFCASPFLLKCPLPLMSSFFVHLQICAWGLYWEEALWLRLEASLLLTWFFHYEHIFLLWKLSLVSKQEF